MRREEPPEERKLSAVKSWFLRSASFGSLHGPSDPASDGIPDNSLFKEGGAEVGAVFTNLRQLSMRRSRPSGEIEKDSTIGSPSMTPRNVTPLTPLTPLRWKSNAREQEEEERALERSKLWSSVTAAEEQSEDEVGRKSGKEAQIADLQQQGEPATDTAAHDRTKSVDELSLKAHMGTEENNVVESSAGHERKPSSGEDVMTMTIEFLRARLLSERSASKAAKQRVQQLAKTVAELELKLEQATEEQKTADVSADEALWKLKISERSPEVADKTAGEAQDQATFTKSALPAARSGSSRDNIKRDWKADERSTADLSTRTDPNGICSEKVISSNNKQVLASASKIEERTADRGHLDVWATPQKMSEMAQELIQKQESRAAIENRLRSMWIQISEEMSALAEERSPKDADREELMIWMGQVPAVLQDIIPTRTLASVQNMHSHSADEGTRSKGVPVGKDGEYQEGYDLRSSSQSGDVSPSSEFVQDKVQLDSEAKKTAVIFKEYEAEESAQREWERNYYASQQKLAQYKACNHKTDPTFSEITTSQNEYPRASNRGGPDDPSFFGLPQGRLAKSKSSNDFVPTKSNRHPPDLNSSRTGGRHVNSDIRMGESGESVGVHKTLYTYNEPVHQQISPEPAFRDSFRPQDKRSVAPMRLDEGGNGGCSERQLEQEQGPYYQDSGVRSGYPPNPQRGLADRYHRPPINRSSEDAYRRFEPDHRGGRATRDEREDRNNLSYRQGRGERRVHETQAGYADASSQADRDYYLRQREREDPYRSPQPEGMYRHHHRRSLSDNSKWPAVEDYDLPNLPPEQAADLERRQSFSGYPGLLSSAHSGYHNTIHWSHGNIQHRYDTTYGAHAYKPDSYSVAKAGNGSRQHFEAEGDRNGPSKAELPLSLGYGPAYDAPKEDSLPQQSPKNGSNKNVNDVLRALQIAKANIQKSGSEKIPYVQALRTVSGHLPEEIRFNKDLQHKNGAPGSRYLTSSAKGANYDSRDLELGREVGHQPHRDAITEANGHNSYVDMLNVGKGIQFFF